MNDDQKRDELLQSYLLGTASDADRARAEALIGTEEGCAALEREKQRLSLLDFAALHTPAEGLAQNALRRVHQSKTTKPTVRWTSHIWQFGLATVAICIVAAVMLPAFARSREAARRASCQNNLKQLGIVFKMYAGESKDGLFPPLGPYNGIWMVDIKAIYPEYLTDLNVLIDPSHPQMESLTKQMREAQEKTPVDYETIARIAAKSYTYTGWLLRSDADIVAAKRVLAENDLGELDHDIHSGSNMVPRLKEGVARFLITDIANPGTGAMHEAEIPVMFDTVTPESAAHIPGAANVLYMDGHIDFINQGSRFPVTPTAQELLAPRPLVEK